MRTILLLILTLQLITPAFAQKKKVKVKKDIVYVDKVPQFKIEYTVRTNSMTIYSLEDKKLALFRAQDYNDESERTSANPEGAIRYYSVTFFNDEMSQCEIPNHGLKKALAKDILDNNLIENGELNEPAIKQFIKIYGSKFSEDKNSSTTIIIKN